MATYTDPTTIVTTSQPNAVQPSSLVLLVGGILTLVFAGFFYLQVASTQQAIAKAESTIATRDSEITALKPVATQLDVLNRQAHNLHLLFDNKKTMPTVLDVVSQRLHKDMAVTSVQITDKGAVTIAGVVKDYVTYAKIYQAFNDVCGQQYFSLARPSAVAKITDQKTGNSYVNFGFDLTLQSAVLNAGSLSTDPVILKKMSECDPENVN